LFNTRPNVHTTPNAQTIKEKMIHWTLWKSRKKFLYVNDTTIEWKVNAQSGRAYLQITYMTKDFYSEYINTIKTQ
jgi:hypothetical protein